MPNNNVRKRAAHERAVREELTRIFNDPNVMPNVDCEDLCVSITELTFGDTVRDIYLGVRGSWRFGTCAPEDNPHIRYLRDAKAKGEKTYVDLTDVMVYAAYRESVAKELQRRLALQYTPRIHWIE